MAFAIPGDIAEQWRPLSPAEVARAGALLDMAAILIRRNISASELATADGQATAKLVSIEMVIDALVPGHNRGKSSYSLTVGGIAESATLLNGTATITLTEAHLKLFGLPGGPVPVGYFGDGPVS